MFILTPIAINLSLTSKRAHMCSLTLIAVSLAFSSVSSSFFLYLFCQGFQTLERRRRDCKLHFTVNFKTNFSQHQHYFVYSNGENVRKWIPKVVSKFHDNPTVDESRIVVLLGQVLSVYGEKKLRCERHLSKNQFQTWCSNFTTIQRLMSPGSSFY